LAVTVKVSRTGFAAVTESMRRVATPLASTGVMVMVPVSLAAIDAVVELKVNDFGAPATVQVTVVDREFAPGALAASVSWPFSDTFVEVPLTVQTLYVIVASPAVIDSPRIGRTTPEVPVSVQPLLKIAVCNVVVPSAAPAFAVRAISFA
jgi:hypothetical protein